MRSLWRSRPPTLVLVLALLASGCGSSTASTSPAPSAAATPGTTAVAPSPSPTPTPAEVTATIATLAASGIAARRDPSDTQPIAPVTGTTVLEITLRQATTIAAEPPDAGILGRDLNDIAPLPADAPPMAYLVAAWVSAYQSPGAERARALLGTRDWKHPGTIVFPTMVVLLFVADLARGQTATRAGPMFELAALRQPLPTVTLCEQISGFVSDTLAKLFEKLKSGADTVLAVIWNVAVGLAQDVVVGLAKSLAAPVIAAIKVAAGIIGTLAYMTSLLRQWQVASHADDNARSFGVGEPGPIGEVRINVDSSAQSSLPEEVIQCAKLADVEVPSAEPPGRPVTWELISDAPILLATQIASDTDFTVRPDRTARLTFQIGQESAATAKGPPLASALVVRATVERISAASISKIINALLGQFITLPDAAKELLAPLTDEVQKKMGDLARPWSFSTVQINYHEPPDCPVEDGRWGGDFGQDVILKTNNGAGGRLVSAGTMTFDVSCLDVTAGHMTFTEWALVAGLDIAGTTATCRGENLTYTITKGTVSRPEGGFPQFDLDVAVGGTVSCDPALPFLTTFPGTTKVTLRATAQHADQLLGVADDIFPMDDPRVVASLDEFTKNGGSYTAHTGWTLTRGPLPTLAPGATATAAPQPTESSTTAAGPTGVLTVQGVDYPFAASVCAFSKAEAVAAGVGDQFGDDAKILISGTTVDGKGLTVDILANGTVGDSIELYSTDLKTVNWISTTYFTDLAFGIDGRHVTANTKFIDRSDGTFDASKASPGKLDVICP